MAWKKILNFLNTGFGTFLLVFAFVLFFSFFLGTHNTFADDFSSTLTWPLSSWFYFCNDSDPDLPSCSDYSYLSISAPYDSCLNVSSGPILNNALYGGFGAFRTMYLSIGDLSSVYVYSFQSMNSCSGKTLTYDFTLFESFPPDSDCPVCEECQQCPAVPENPYDDKFDKIIVAIYTCGAIILVIYFFYCIYGMIIKSTGGK